MDKNYPLPNNRAIILATFIDSEGFADCTSKSVFFPTARRRMSRVNRPSGLTARRTMFFCLPNDMISLRFSAPAYLKRLWTALSRSDFKILSAITTLTQNSRQLIRIAV